MSKRNYTVYMHRNLINDKVYIGMTSQKLTARWGACGSRYRKSKKIWADICEYGWENFSHTICASGITQKAARKMERALIKEYRAQDPQYGYNTTAGGEVGTPGYPGSFKNKFGYANPASKRVYCPELGYEFGSINQAALFACVTP